MEIRKDITARFGTIYFGMAVFGLLIVGKIFMIQQINTGRLEEIGKDLKNNTTEIPANRGNLCADDGSILATSIPYFELRLDLVAPQVQKVFSQKADSLSIQMAEFFGISRSQFKQRLVEGFSKKNRWFLIHSEKINYNQLQEFEALSMMKKANFGSGLIINKESERVLPHGDMASRTIGTLNKGAFGGIHGNIGYSGIEGLVENYLSGTNGKALKRNYSGRWIEIPMIDPRDGYDVVTTINVNLQDYAQNALMRQMEISQAQWGTAVVMETKTGNIKAIANLGLRKDGTYAETYNFALGHAGCSEPGSTFKLMSLMVAMEEGYITDTSAVYDTGSGVWEYRGQKIYDSDYQYGGHGPMSVKQIFEKSSNVGVAKIITQNYENKKEDFINRIYSFGLNKPLGLGFVGEGVPSIKYPGDASWWGPSLAWISYGYEIKITPLQTLTFYNAVANNGKMIKPRFVSEVRQNGLLVKKFETEVLNPAICSRETLGKARGMLEGVCANGTGKSLQNPWFPVAGKTGTAQIAYDNQGYEKDGQKNYQASFAGYFPADNPQYSCIVVIVGPKGKYYGGSVAGPVFQEIVGKVYATFLEQRKDTSVQYAGVPTIKAGFKNETQIAVTDLSLQVPMSAVPGELVKIDTLENRFKVEKIDTHANTVPDLIGMGSADALYLLEDLGLRVKLNGAGKVVAQSIPAGSITMRGQTIIIDLG